MTKVVVYFLYVQDKWHICGNCLLEYMIFLEFIAFIIVTMKLNAATKFFANFTSEY